MPAAGAANRRISHLWNRALSLFMLICLLASPATIAAQEIGAPDIENSKYQFTGVVNSNAVYVRSGPSENDYPTMKLDKGAEVTGVGVRFDWLKITPPEGSFCYVAKAYVDRRGDGGVGRVTNTLNVRVGSQLNELKAKIAIKLEPGADVQIVGEEQEYFKIKPPEGVYFYVNKQFVDPVRKADLAANDPAAGSTGTPPAALDQSAANMPTNQPLPDDVSRTQTPSTLEPGFSPGTQPTETLSQRSTESSEPATPTLPPTTQHDAAAEAEFERLEAAYAEVSLKPLQEQPVAELLDGYQKLAGGDGLPESLRRICDFKAEVLKSRLEAQQQFADTQKHLDQMNQKQMALKAENEELEQRIKESEVVFYTAVGTLRPSSLQQGTETLYRLTDPANGRTVVYLRSNDGKLAQMIGQFVGVKGEITTDSKQNMRTISPTHFELVNPGKVGQSVAAQIVPPSLLPTGTARTE